MAYRQPKHVTCALLLSSWVALAGCGEPASVADVCADVGGSAAPTPRAVEGEGRPAPPDRAARIAAAQRNGGPGYHFSRLQAPGRAVPVVTGSNAAQGFAVELHRGVVQLRRTRAAAGEAFTLRWAGLGRHDRLVAVSPPPAGAFVTANRVSWLRADGSEEWYLNGPFGLEQGFVLDTRPAGHGAQLILAIAVEGGLVPQLGPAEAAITLRRPTGEPVAHYGELYAHDATGAELPTRLEVAGQNIRLVVEDQGARYPVTVDPLVWLDQQKLFASDATMGDHFGGAVAISGDVALVGNADDNDLGSHSGSAYLYARTGSQWAEQQKVLASDGTQGDWFGWSVAVSGDTALVGAYGRDDKGIDSGAAYVFVRNGSSWVQQQKLLASDGQQADWFGWSVSMDGDTALISAAGDDDGGMGAGSAYVFQRSGNTWTEQQKLLANDGGSEDWFGWSVTLDGDTAIVGSFADDDQGEDSGSAYVFVHGGGQWTLQQKLIPTGGGAATWFGRAVALSGDTLVASALGAGPIGDLSGAAYVFARTGSSWGQQQKLTASDAADNDLFGWALAISDDRVLIGAHENDDQGIGSGSAYVFALTGTTWVEEEKLVAGDGTENDSFGKAVALSERTALIGAPDDLDTVVYGSAYVFEGKLTDGEPCTEDDECLSGFCVDGVCCDTDCGGGSLDDCLACSSAAGAAQNGVCGPSTGNPCDDGELCTEADACAAGTCAGSPLPCPLGAPCEAQGSCDPATGQCVYTPAPNGTACDDQDACTDDDACAAGSCQGSPAVCAAQSECHDSGTCSSQTGSCSSPPKPDGTPCSIGACWGGVCLAGEGGAPPVAGGYLIEQRCGCRAPGGSVVPPWWLLGAVLVAVRRRPAWPGRGFLGPTTSTDEVSRETTQWV